VSLVVLVILAMVWAVFLLPQLFRARAERSTDSIGTFRRQLSVLERTSPAGVSTAPRLRTAVPATRHATVRTAMPASSRANMQAQVRTPAVAGVQFGALPATVARRPRPNRAIVRKRRQDILCGLLMAMAATLVLSFIPATRVMLWVHLCLDLAFVAYVALLVRARNLASERELKVRFLPSASRSQPQLLLQRSAN
jgi:hypothetical protein